MYVAINQPAFISQNKRLLGQHFFKLPNPIALDLLEEIAEPLDNGTVFLLSEITVNCCTAANLAVRVSRTNDSN